MEKEKTFEGLTEESLEELVNIIFKLTPRDENSEGKYFEGTVEGFKIRSYKSPDGKALVIKEADKTSIMFLSESAFLGFSLGDAIPSFFRV